MSGEGKGCCMNIEEMGKGYLANFVFCAVGAIAVLWLWNKVNPS